MHGPSVGAQLAIGPISQNLIPIFQEVHLTRTFRRHHESLTDLTLRDLNRVMETQVFSVFLISRELKILFTFFLRDLLIPWFWHVRL